MKLFLRYQISGMVFIMWSVIFYHGDKASNFNGLFQEIKNSLTAVGDIKSLAVILVAIALPIGVLIHQFSVLIKNWLVGLILKEFSDNPEHMPKDIDYSNEKNKYYLKHISNLNSFYYVRIDNGLIAPILAFLLVYFSRDSDAPPINCYWYWVSGILAFITCVYIYQIYKDICFYLKEDNFKKIDPCRACKIEINFKQNNK